ncbi:MAG: glycosyltransferase [Tepidisphaeraceae bacterium]
MNHLLKASGRAIKYGALKWYADRRVAQADAGNGSAPAIRSAYLIGCGRSGTTVCGEVLRHHPEVYYFYEPYHLWASIDPTIDVLNLYHIGSATLLLGADRCNERSRRRFNRLLLQPAERAGANLMVEKTPFNACRIGYLDALSPGCKFIHLIRDGVDVVRSIDRLSRDRSYGIVGKRDLNRWWGRGGSKWTALAMDGSGANYFPDEIPLLQSYESKGAYEWLVSLGEIDRWRGRLGDRLLEITYDELTTNPQQTLRRICEFFGVAVNDKWLARSLAKIDTARRNYGIPLVLPPKMAEAFNRSQERFKFVNRAVVGTPQSSSLVQLAVISNEPTPYRLHVQERMAKELEGVAVHNIFTHTISNPSMPWQMRVAPELNPIFFAQNHINAWMPISLRHIRLFHDIQQHLIQHGIQMIILLGYNDWTRLLLIRWARRAGIPLVLTADSNIFADARTSWLLRRVKRPFLRWVLRRVAGLMPMGTCGRAYFRSYLDHNLPEFLFPYEPDYASLSNIDEREVAAFRARHNLAPDRKRLLYCGRLIAIKRVDVLLEAFTRVALARPEWDVVIAGDGPLRKSLEASLNDTARPRVKWLGFLQFHETVLAYHACDVLVHPSEYEPWALVINEAIACELPIIATSVVGAAVELVRHRENGLIISPRSVEAMTDALWEITKTDRYLEMKAGCAPMLDLWRRAADPVEGVRESLRHFGLIWRQPSGVAARRESASPSIANTENRLTNFSPAEILAQSQNIPQHPRPQSQP